MRNSVRDNFERYGDLLLDLFCRASRPLRDDLDVVVRHIRIGLDGQIVKGNGAPDKQQGGEGQNQQPVAKGEIDNSSNHACFYCSDSALSARASFTSCWPGEMPDVTSCVPF